MSNRLKQISTLCITLTFFACLSTSKSHRISNFTGHIYEHKYNGMPMVDKPSSKGTPLKTMVYVYAPTNIYQIEDGLHLGTIITKINTSIIDSVQTDENGAYSLYLKPGKYSVFVKYENGYYVPFYAGKEAVSLIEISPKQPTILDVNVRASSNFQ